MAGSIFAAADAALNALPSQRLAAMRDQAEPREQEHISRFLKDSEPILSSWLVARVVFSSTTALASAQLIQDPRWWAQLLAGLAGALFLYGGCAQIAVVIARARAQVLAPKLLRLLHPIEWIITPVAAPLSLLGKIIGNFLAHHPQNSEVPKITESEVEYLVEDAKNAGEIDAVPAEMIQNVLDFKDLVVRDVMVPRIKMSTISIDTPMATVLGQISEQGHSRYPVFLGNTDEIVGILYTKDLFRVLQGGSLQDVTIQSVVRSLTNFVPETQAVSQVLRDMRSRRHHMAIVLDEYGGVSGLVTLEDILEEIVGDIRDEHDGEEEAPIVDLGDGRLLVDAAVSLMDLSAFLGTDIASEGDYGSLGGLLTHEAGRVPSEGTHIVSSGIEFIIRESNPKCILKVEIILPPPSSRTYSGPAPILPSSKYPEAPNPSEAEVS
jgi:putative hemolysin